MTEIRSVGKSVGRSAWQRRGFPAIPTMLATSVLTRAEADYATRVVQLSRDTVARNGTVQVRSNVLVAAVVPRDGEASELSPPMGATWFNAPVPMAKVQLDVCQRGAALGIEDVEIALLALPQDVSESGECGVVKQQHCLSRLQNQMVLASAQLHDIPEISLPLVALALSRIHGHTDRVRVKICKADRPRIILMPAIIDCAREHVEFVRTLEYIPKVRARFAQGGHALEDSDQCVHVALAATPEGGAPMPLKLIDSCCRPP